MANEPRSFYITCAIDYVNSKPHLGTAYEKIAADALARYHRLCGDDVYLLLGNDEHSLNVERAARKQGLEPQTYTDQMAETFESVWKRLDISYDVFIRTTEPRHHRSVQRMFQAIYDNGDIFKGKYKGYYCVSCEGFKQEKDLVDGKCPVHQTEPEWIEEENYFFKLSRFAEPLLEHFRAHPEFLVPESRRNEIVNVIESGLDDISVSRPGSGWGVPLPIDPTQGVYVWFDALINYATAAGYGEDEDRERFAHRWPADLHVIGKDITRFHCIIWPAMLMSAGVPLPKQVLGHGWVTFRGEKLSKSLGNIVDPLEAADRFGADPLRFYLLKEVPLDRDGDFSWELFIERYNTELANDLGNLMSRSLTMAVKYFGGDLPAGAVEETDALDAEVRAVAEKAVSDYRRHFDNLAIHEAIGAAWTLIRRANQYIEETAPFKLAKDDAQRDRLATVLNVLLESIRISTLLLTPVMPQNCAAIRRAIRSNADESALTLDDARWDPSGFRPAGALEKPDPLFPRIERES